MCSTVMTADSLYSPFHPASLTHLEVNTTATAQSGQDRNHEANTLRYSQ